MTDRRITLTDATNAEGAPTDGDEPIGPGRIGHSMGAGALSSRRHRVVTPEDAESQYVAARDAWTAAMRAANSGRPADLAALAIAQEAYEAAALERDRWQSGARVAIPVDAQPERRPIDVVVGQELAWRQVHATEESKPGLFGRMKRRLQRDRR